VAQYEYVQPTRKQE